MTIIIRVVTGKHLHDIVNDRDAHCHILCSLFLFPFILLFYYYDFNFS